VVVGVDVQVQERRPARGGELLEHGAVPPFGHVGDALEHPSKVGAPAAVAARARGGPRK
jgi:hypothetical protein